MARVSDKERLDYLQQQYHWKRMVVLDYLNVGGGSIRQAIDAAIRAERKRGKG